MVGGKGRSAAPPRANCVGPSRSHPVVQPPDHQFESPRPDSSSSSTSSGSNVKKSMPVKSSMASMLTTVYRQPSVADSSKCKQIAEGLPTGSSSRVMRQYELGTRIPLGSVGSVGRKTGPTIVHSSQHWRRQASCSFCSMFFQIPRLRPGSWGQMFVSRKVSRCGFGAKLQTNRHVRQPYDRGQNQNGCSRRAEPDSPLGCQKKSGSDVWRFLWRPDWH